MSKLIRGFAALLPQQRREIASRGGKASHANGTAHVWTSETAAAAGRIGGLSISRDREHMRKIGRIGGLKRRQQTQGE